MRGQLRIRSARAPYRRAGLVFGGQPQLVDIRDIDGGRLLQLARDPVLTIEMGDDVGQYRPMAALDASITVQAAQMMVDAIAAELPERAAVIDPDDPAQLKAEIAVMRERMDRQAEVAMRQADEIVALQRELADRTAEINALKTKAKASAKTKAVDAAAS